MRNNVIMDDDRKHILEAHGALQVAQEVNRCPRCGYRPMNPQLMLNALSRHAKVYICESCGMEEAMMDAAHQPPLPFEEWSLFRDGQYLTAEDSKAVQDKKPPISEQEPARDTFMSAVPDVRDAQYVKNLYALGLMLNQECPDNDCVIYKNIFNMARELDGAIEIVSGYPAQVLETRLHERIRELRELWINNAAILAYRAQHGTEGETPGPWHPGFKGKSDYAAEALTGRGRRQAPPQS